ncbi:hypothetical protein HDZ31DRAFT_44573 [Schizophyllum fasciatum]
MHQGQYEPSALAIEWERIVAQRRSEERLPLQNPDHRDNLIASFVATAVLKSVPELSVHYDASYSAAMAHPFDAEVTPLSRHRRVTGMITASVNIVTQDGGAENPRELVAGPPYTAAPKTGLCSPSDSTDLWADAHLLLPRRPKAAVPFALVCVATHDEIYHAMTSSLLQRHLFSSQHPLIGLAFAPDSWKVCVVIGWISHTSDPRECDICFANAPFSHIVDHSMGVFDISHTFAATALVQFLSQQAPLLKATMAGVRTHASGYLMTVGRPGYRSWRLDLTRRKRHIGNQSRCDDVLQPNDCGHNPTSLTTIMLKYLVIGNATTHCTWLVRARMLSAHAIFQSPFGVQKLGKYLVPVFRIIDSDPLPPDTQIIQSLIQNHVQPYAWPPPDMPSDFPGVLTMKPLIEDYLLHLLFASDSSNKIATPRVSNWTRYCIEVAREQQLRTRHHLPDLRSAEGARRTIMNILPTIGLVSESARAASRGDFPGARTPCDTLIAACLYSEDAHGPHVRHEREVRLPRNAYFDQVHCGSRAQEDSRIENRYCDVASGCLSSLHWDYPASSGESSWLNDFKLSLSTRIHHEEQHRSFLGDLWAINHGPNHELIDTSVMDARSCEVGDTVAFVSVPDAFDIDPADEGQVRSVEDFGVIGRRLPKACSRSVDASSSASTEDIDDDHDVQDSVLYEVQIMDENGAPDERQDRLVETGPPAPPFLHRPVRMHGHNSTSLPESSNEIQLPFLWLEDATRHTNFLHAFSGARMRLVSCVRFYEAIGIYDLVVFALATEGSCVHLLCGWGSKPAQEEHDGLVVSIADTNCPVWDLRDSTQAIRFCVFLTRLADAHACKVREAFQACKQDFKQAWNADANAPRFQWTMKHQQASSLVSQIRQERSVQEDRLRGIRGEMEKIKREIEDMEESVRLEDLRDRWPGWPYPGDISSS